VHTAIDELNSHVNGIRTSASKAESCLSELSQDSHATTLIHNCLNNDSTILIVLKRLNSSITELQTQVCFFFKNLFPNPYSP